MPAPAVVMPPVKAAGAWGKGSAGILQPPAAPPTNGGRGGGTGRGGAPAPARGGGVARGPPASAAGFGFGRGRGVDTGRAEAGERVGRGRGRGRGRGVRPEEGAELPIATLRPSNEATEDQPSQKVTAFA
jgi:hypothetical protein